MRKKKQRLDYEEVLKMLNSSDKESCLLGMAIIDSVDFNQNIVCIMLLYKNSTCERKDWESELPHIVKKIVKLNGDEKVTYNSIFKMFKRISVPMDQIELYMKTLNSFILSVFKESGYDYIESITVKFKEDESHGKLSESSQGVDVG
jgi:hypothetical protein